jgi:hypothetical protein
MHYGSMTVELSREPVEVAVFVDGERHSGPFVANHQRRGLSIANTTNTMRLTADEGLALLGWLQKEEQTLRAMVDEEVEAAAAVEQRLKPLANSGQGASGAEGYGRSVGDPSH